jgi:hypothetical protein
MAPGGATVFAGRAATERVQPQRYHVADDDKHAQEKDPPHADTSKKRPTQNLSVMLIGADVEYSRIQVMHTGVSGGAYE